MFKLISGLNILGVNFAKARNIFFLEECSTEVGAFHPLLNCQLSKVVTKVFSHFPQKHCRQIGRQQTKRILIFELDCRLQVADDASNLDWFCQRGAPVNDDTRRLYLAMLMHRSKSYFSAHSPKCRQSRAVQVQNDHCPLSQAPSNKKHPIPRIQLCICLFDCHHL